MTAATQISLLEQHPLSAAFPSMPENELAALALDIETHGQREQGVLLDGMVLDGWHRYLACHRLGVQFKAKEYDGDDPVAFVISHNLHRRHLTASQRAAAVVSASNWRSPGVQSGKAAAAATMTEAQMANAAEVSPRTIRHAKVAEIAGLGDKVRDGEVSAERAAQVAKLPKAKREKALKQSAQPKAPKEKKSTADVDKLQVRISALETQLTETKESLAEMADLAASAKAFEEKAEFKEMQILRVELKSCKRRRDELMAQNAELKKEVQRWRKKAGK